MNSKQKKIATVKQIRRLDQIAIEKYGVPSIALMENAGKCVSGKIVDILKRQRKKLSSSKVYVVCGVGNNAGDGFVVARHLINAGINSKILLIGKGEQLKQDALVNYQIIKNLKYPVFENKKAIKELSNIVKSDITVDAIFGVGLNREVKDPFRLVIEEINRAKRKVLSVDIPSGLDGTTGKIYGVCIKADWTVTFSFAKKGLFLLDGKKMSGKIDVVDIGIPDILKKRIIK